MMTLPVAMVALVVLSINTAPGWTGKAVIPFTLAAGHKIFVRGEVEGVKDVRMLIDTGAETTVLSKRFAAKLELPSMRTIHYYDAGAEIRQAPLVRIRRFVLGPIRMSLSAIVAEFPVRADVIVGLDVLRRANFTIDYRTRKIAFGASEPFASGVPFDSEHALVVVTATVRSHPVRLAVDTGADALCLYTNSPRVWHDRIEFSTRRLIHHLSGASISAPVGLKSVQIGPRMWRDLPAMMVGRHNPAGLHGILAISSLGLERVHFDFRRNLLSWE
jgi:predicted aspartyl protease